MNPVLLALQEIRFRWVTGGLFMVIVAVITGTVAYFSVNDRGFQKEVIRNARDIGSNVVILPAEVDQVQYHMDGGYSDITMPESMVQQIVEYRASLNHLIPMLERRAEIQADGKSVSSRVVGISASIPMPGRPKAPMQKSVKAGSIQLGCTLAEVLGVKRDQKSRVLIQGREFPVSRVNRSNGTWQDGAAFMDLKTAQELFESTDQISRIEAIECTSEQCELTGLKSDVVLANELARITDQAMILRREKMATARGNIRSIAKQNSQVFQNVLWTLLAVALVVLSGWNSVQRGPEIGVLQALGYGQLKVAFLFVVRAFVLAATGTLVGACSAGSLALWRGQQLFAVTGKKMSVDWPTLLTICAVAVGLAMMASCIPALIAAFRHPAEIIGKDR